MKKLKSVLLTGAMLLSANSFAHGMMDMTYPADGAMMMEQAERLEMHFEAPVRLVNLKVVGEDGKPVAIQFDRSAPATEHVMVPIPQLAPNRYTVHWKAMGPDGHVMKGSYGFMQH